MAHTDIMGEHLRSFDPQARGTVKEIQCLEYFEISKPVSSKATSSKKVPSHNLLETVN